MDDLQVVDIVDSVSEVDVLESSQIFCTSSGAMFSALEGSCRRVKEDRNVACCIKRFVDVTFSIITHTLNGHFSDTKCREMEDPCSIDDNNKVPFRMANALTTVNLSQDGQCSTLQDMEKTKQTDVLKSLPSASKEKI